MSLATEVSQTFSAFNVLLIALNAVAPIAVTIWVKVLLYRRREAKEREEALRLHDQRHADHARSSVQCRPGEMMRTLPRDFRPKSPLGLYVVPKPYGLLTSTNTNRGTDRTKPTQSSLHCAATPPASTHHVKRTILWIPRSFLSPSSARSFSSS